MMADDVMDAEFKPLAVVEQTQEAPALFGTTDPVQSITKMVAVADALKSILVGKKLVSNIQGKEYVQVEGWQVLAGMLRVSAVIEWTREVEGGGWESRCIVKDPMGNTIGAGEGQCTREERTWSKRDGYALRAMAQTRATSRALRNVLGFIVTLAGFSPTPAEEIPRDGPAWNTPAAAPEPPPTPGPSVEDYKAAWERAGRPESTGRAFMAKHGGTIAGAMAALEKMPDAEAAFRLDPEPEKPTLKAVPDEDPAAKERRRMRAIAKDKGISDDVRRATMIRLFGKTSSKDLSFPQLVQLNGELENWTAP